MKNKKNTQINTDYQKLVNQFADFIELRFGVYLDTVWGFQLNMKEFNLVRQQSMQIVQLTSEELDKKPLIRGDGPPSSDLEKCGRREIHRMPQGVFKNNNSPGGTNYDFAIENCLSDIFNFWNSVKKELGFAEVDDVEILPVTAYMRELRNRVQHDLYGNRIVTPDKGPISIGATITSYPFPSFDIGKPIQLSQKDIEAIIFEVRAQFRAYLIPYINKVLQNQTLAKT